MANRITATLLKRLKEYLDTTSGSIYDFLKEEELDIRPARLKQELDKKYGESFVSDLLISNRGKRLKNKLNTVEECDKRIAKLNKMIQSIENIKANIQ